VRAQHARMRVGRPDHSVYHENVSPDNNITSTLKRVPTHDHLLTPRGHLTTSRTHFTGLSFPGLGLVSVQVVRAVPHATMHMHTKHIGPATDSANSATTSRTTIPGRETAHKASAQGETRMEGGRRSLR
jgi:hypothetical protein